MALIASNRMIYLRNMFVVFFISLIMMYWNLSSIISMNVVLEESNDIVLNSTNVAPLPMDIKHDIDNIQSIYLHLMLCCDEKSKPGLYAVIHSIILHHKCVRNEHLYFHILVEKNHDIFLSEFEILFEPFIHNKSCCIKYEFKSFTEYDEAYRFFDDYHRNDLDHHNINIQYIFKAMNYARFYLADIFDTVTGYALYIDIDTIVLSDISELFYNKEDDICPLYAVYNVDYDEMFNLNRNIFTGLNALGFNVSNDTIDIFKAKRGFNAGIALYNLSYWRWNNFTARYEDIMKMNKQQRNDVFNQGTQPIMNILYRDMDRKCYLNKWWNSLGLGCLKLGGNQWHRIQQSAHILHWNGGNKPWIKCTNQSDNIIHLSCRWRHKEIWRQYLPKQFHPNVIKKWNNDWNFYE